MRVKILKLKSISQKNSLHLSPVPSHKISEHPERVFFTLLITAGLLENKQFSIEQGLRCLPTETKVGGSILELNILY